MVSTTGKVKKKMCTINSDFNNETFLYQFLLSRILSGLAIYLQNDLKIVQDTLFVRCIKT